MTIELFAATGDFAENKDIAKKIRLESIEPTIAKGEEIILDFNGVTSATQSFIHALISNVMREYGVESLDKMLFKNCNENVKTIIGIVVDYVQDGIYTEPE